MKRKDPKKSERKRSAPLFCEEINEQKNKIPVHFVRQTPERRDCGFRVSEVRKEKNVAENAGGIQVDKRTDCREGGQPGCETVRQAQQQRYLVDGYGRCGE